MESDLGKLNDRLVKWHMKLASSKYQAWSMRNTNPSHTKTARDSKLVSVRKETSESPSLLKTPAHCSAVVNKAKKSFRNDYRKKKWQFLGYPCLKCRVHLCIHQGRCRRISEDTGQMAQKPAMVSIVRQAQYSNVLLLGHLDRDGMWERPPQLMSSVEV